MLNEFPWRTTALPEALNSIPSLLSEDERRHLYWLTCTKYSGRGEIVDLGAFLGSSAACMALGAGPRLRGRIKCYDLFHRSPGLLSTDLLESPQFTCIRNLPPEGSFLPLFIQNVADLAQALEPRPGDLLQQRWDGGPIELMHIDVWKTWELTDHIIREFFGHLQPGAIVVHQDIKLQYTDWIIIAMGCLRGYFRPLTSAFPSTIAFELIESISPAVLHAGYGPELRQRPDAETHFDWLMSLLEDASDRSLVDGARLYMLLCKGQFERALALKNLCRLTYPEWCYQNHIVTVLQQNPQWHPMLHGQIS